MALPDQSLIPVGFSAPELERTVLSSLNPFQLRMFLNLHQHYDRFLKENVQRTLRGDEQKINVEKLMRSTLELTRDEERHPSLAYRFAQQSAELLAFSLSGNEECKKLTEISIRGILDINEPTYARIYSYFEDYTSNLGLLDGSRPLMPADERFLSNRAGFMKLNGDLAGYRLHSLNYPDSQKYSDENFKQFQKGTIGRILNLIESSR